MEKKTPEEIWNELGEEGRELVRYWASIASEHVHRHVPEDSILSSIETLTCTLAPIELLAKDRGCSCDPCEHPQRGIAHRRRTLEEIASYDHAAILLRIFLEDPHLAYPADIPDYALRVHKRALALADASRRRNAKAQRKAVAKQRKLAAKAAAKAAKTAYKRSYTYRIAKAEERAARVVVKIEEAEKTLKKLKRKLTGAQRSVAALRRAAEKKGEHT